MKHKGRVDWAELLIMKGVYPLYRNDADYFFDSFQVLY